MGHSKNNEANVLQNSPKIIYLWYISTSFFLKVSEPATQVKWLLTWVSHHSRINSLHAIFLSCLIIFGMTHIVPFPSRLWFGLLDILAQPWNMKVHVVKPMSNKVRKCYIHEMGHVNDFFSKLLCNLPRDFYNTRTCVTDQKWKSVVHRTCL